VTPRRGVRPLTVCNADAAARHPYRSIFRIFPKLPLYNAAAGRFFDRFSVVMQKTKKSVAKRFKISGTGKLMHRSPGTRHLLAHKSSKRKRRLGQSKALAYGHAYELKKCLPFGL